MKKHTTARTPLIGHDEPGGIPAREFSLQNYPELSQTMAMKIGREYSSAKVTPQDFEQLTEEAGLAKPLVRRRVPEFAGIVIAALGKMDLIHPVAEAVANLIRQRCEM